jgi:hypothetical protein
MKLKTQITLITLIPNSAYSETGDKNKITSQRKHSSISIQHKRNNRYGANNPNERNDYSAHRDQLALITLITLDSP